MIASYALALAAGAVQGPPPPIVEGQRRPPMATLIDFVPGAASCDGQPVAPILVERPNPGASSVPIVTDGTPTALNFRIDESGRPLSIVSAGRGGAPVEVTAAFAAWRFAPGAPRTGCTIAFAREAVSVETGPAALVHRALALPHERTGAEEAIGQRLAAEGGDCFTPTPPEVRLRGFPDFKAIAQPPGTSSYAMIGFDIDRRGKPVRVRVLSSDGNAALDRASIDAVRRSRFAPKARTGCSYPYHRRQQIALAPPPPPPLESFRKPEATCAIDPDTEWTLPPRLTFPEPFRRRAIEGWAVIGYDVAPWGDTGNVTVLASEPAAAFGVEALRIVRMAKRKPSSTGATGCVERVVFRMPAE
ncbi:TonB family protein [Sphingomonas sp.]|uniref:energy transducer TonB n=1 Tax=Sphingomonas sp. TaxID=28214 RepID=UPI002C115CDF|nr:TonB family protein [Sphingomonas sp.]HWK37248.1 TonB family protein [Sphingomonas sp.]